MQLKKFSQAAQKVLVQCREIAKKNHSLWVEPEHLALALIKTVEVGELLSKKNIEQQALETNLLHLISKLPAGVKEDPSFSKRTIQALSQAEALSLSKGHENIFVSDIFLSLVENREKYGSLGPVIAKFFLGQEPKSNKKVDSALLSVTDNINSLVIDKKLDPVFGRSDEILRLIQVLCRKTRNNPILIGEPGVGRTSIVYGLTKLIVEQKIPANLISKEILALDVGALISGTTLRGQFEERMRKVILELSEQQGRYILFVRDLSLLMGAGGEGASDAANMLKPSLARGLIQVIGLSTPDVYKKRIEADPSFERFFQPLWIEQPSLAECEQILQNLKGKYEQFHGVFIEDDAVKAAIELGSRHLFGRVLPELALNILDEACSRHRIIMDEKPKSLTELSERLMKLKIKGQSDAKLEATLEKKTKDYERELDIIESMRAIKNELFELENRLNIEKSKGDIKKAAQISNYTVQELRQKLANRHKELLSIKKRQRFIDPLVKRDDVAVVISQETGIPVKKMLQSERAKLENMEELLSANVIGQKEAISAVGNAIRRARVGLKDIKKPIGSFLFLGPTGVGKTELARTLTNFLFDDERAMVRFDMSEFMERHSIARLIGAPPGYQGSEEGGQLTEKIRRKPYSVLLFDEIEKAHSDVLNLLLQVLDEGRLTDSSGHLVHFANTVIIMTSNIGADILLKDKVGQKDQVRNLIMERLLHHLRPELINRIDEIVIFNAIDQEGIKGICDLMLQGVVKRMAHEGFSLVIEPEVKNHLILQGYSREFGARPLKRTIQRLLENPLAMALIKGGFNKGDIIYAKWGANGIEFAKE